MEPTAQNNEAPGVAAPKAPVATASDTGNHSENSAQSTIFDELGIDRPTGADLAAAALAAHAADPNPAKATFVDKCCRVLLAALDSGPCSLAEARARAGLAAPDGVDGRAAGLAIERLHAAGRIEPAGWFDRSPWRNCHDSPSRVWRLPTGGAR
ncbi:hypothetical protein LBMAG53_22750 [Planctomycetota bacterium]|nr:hypothetical protein LBMAG53_22750 [Planctomycetota bacterium]